MLQNSQCSVNAAGSSVSAAGNTVTWVVGLTFKAGYAGSKNISASANDSSGLTSGWTAIGAWNPMSATSATSGSSVVITPSTPPTIYQGDRFKFTANSNVSWSLAPGSQGSINPDGTYHAPAKLAAAHVEGGCQIMPNDSVFNTRIDNLPVDPKMAQLNWAAVMGGNLHWGAGFNIMTVDSTFPAENLNFLYTPQSNAIYSVPDQLGPLNAWFRIESGWFTWDQNYDRHAIMVDKNTCHVEEIYNYLPLGTIAPPNQNVNAVAGDYYEALQYTQFTGGVDAADMPILPLIVNNDEILSGHINHALRVSFQSVACNVFVWPAGGAACGSGGATGIPMGERFRLKASVYNAIMPTLSPIARTLANQLAQYGIINADTRDNWDISAGTSFRTPDVSAAMNELANAIHPSADFEAVDESSFMI